MEFEQESEGHLRELEKVGDLLTELKSGWVSLGFSD